MLTPFQYSHDYADTNILQISSQKLKISRNRFGLFIWGPKVLKILLHCPFKGLRKHFVGKAAEYAKTVKASHKFQKNSQAKNVCWHSQ